MTSSTFLKKAMIAATGTTIVTLAGGQAVEAITINFGGSSTNASLISDTVGGIGYTATGFSTTDNRLVARRSNGLGVFLEGVGDSPQIDGLGSDETLQLAFDQEIHLISATFSQVQGNSTFQLLVDGDLLVSNGDIPANNIFDFTSFALSDRTGSILGFTVTSTHDEYFLSSIEVEPIPEPLTMLGSLSALGIGAFLKKQSAKSQKKE